MANTYGNARRQGSGILSFISRFVVGAIVLAITAFLTPGFTIAGLFPLLVAAAVIAVLDYVVFRLFKLDASPFGRGITGFIVAAVIIYATGFLVPGYGVTFWGALIAALVYGVVDALIPGKGM